MSKRKKTVIIILAVFLSLIIILTSAYFLLRYLGKINLHKHDKNIVASEVKIDSEDIVTYKKGKYKLDPDVVSILVMGVDKDDITVNKKIGENGQADCIFLAAIDTADKTYKIIPISRETMVDVNIYSGSGIYSGVEHEQLCLAYAYGKTAEASSKNVLTSVSRLFYGINVSYYMTVDLNGIKKFSKTIGGIPVETLEKIKLDGTTYNAGVNVNLIGTKAVDYIRNREDDLEANSRRMSRQKQFLTSLINKTGNLVSDDFTRVATYYNTMMPYLSTNMSLPEITYLASTCLTRDIGSKLQYKTIDGTLSLGEHAEFVPNEESLLSVIFDAFYDKIK